MIIHINQGPRHRGNVGRSHPRSLPTPCPPDSSVTDDHPPAGNNRMKSHCIEDWDDAGDVETGGTGAGNTPAVSPAHASQPPHLPVPTRKVRMTRGATLMNLIFGRSEPRRPWPFSLAGKSTNTPARATRRWFEISVSATFGMLTILCFLEFRGYPPGSMSGLPMVVGPIILGLAGAIFGLLGRSPAMAAVNLVLAFFLVPIYVILWEGYFF